MLKFEELNRMVAGKEAMPDDLCLAETSAWYGLQALYEMYAAKLRSREDSVRMKEQLRVRYEQEAARFDAMEIEMQQAIALLYVFRSVAGTR